MKLVTWNINSIRARTPRLMAWLERERPDVVCLQETKVEDAGFPLEPLRAAGYEVATFGQRSYNGVALLSTAPLTDVTRGFGDEEFTQVADIIAAALTPNPDVAALRQRVENLTEAVPLYPGLEQW